jgi:putative copper export protein
MRMTSTDNTLVRTLHDLGLAAWFGGSLMGVVVNARTGEQQRPTQITKGLVGRSFPSR